MTAVPPQITGLYNGSSNANLLADASVVAPGSASEDWAVGVLFNITEWDSAGGTETIVEASDSNQGWRVAADHGSLGRVSFDVLLGDSVAGTLTTFSTAIQFGLVNQWIFLYFTVENGTDLTTYINGNRMDTGTLANPYGPQAGGAGTFQIGVNKNIDTFVAGCGYVQNPGATPIASPGQVDICRAPAGALQISRQRKAASKNSTRRFSEACFRLRCSGITPGTACR